MNRMNSRLGKSVLAVVVITCAVIFLVFGVLGSIGFFLSNGISRLSDVDWGGLGFHVGRDYDVAATETASLEGIDRLSIETVSASPVVTIGGTELSATLSGTCRSYTTPVVLQVERSGSRLTVRTKYPANGVTSSDLDLAVTIPASYAGALSFATVSGDVVLDKPGLDLTAFKADTVSGAIRLDGVTADAYDLGTVSGRIAVADATGGVTANSVSGDIDVSMADFGASMDCKAETVSGGVALALPKDAAFSVAYHTVSGSFGCDFALVLTKDTRTDTQGSVGTGGPSIRVDTVSGGLRITRR